MEEKSKESAENYSYVFVELVVFQFVETDGPTFTGEAELSLELFADCKPPDISINDIIRTRIDLLTVYDENGHDVYANVMANPEWKQRLELAALEHFIHPPVNPIQLPRKWSEW